MECEQQVFTVGSGETIPLYACSIEEDIVTELNEVKVSPVKPSFSYRFDHIYHGLEYDENLSGKDIIFI